MARLFRKNKIYRAWSFYDWANSAYNLVITSTVFPVYYIAITTQEHGGTKSDIVNFWGHEFVNSALLNYSYAFAYLLIAFLSPILSSIADYKSEKMKFMKFFTYLGAIACMGLFFFYPGKVAYGIILSAIAAIGYCGSLVFYNAYLPEIAPVAHQDQLSARGFAYGYIGSVLLQIICFAFIIYGFDDGTFAPRLSFLLVGIWWLGFAQITFRGLPKNKDFHFKKEKKTHWWGGFQELKKVMKEVQKYPTLKRYLLAFWFYSMGVQTVMLAAAQFGSKEVKKMVNGVWVNLESQDLIITILLIQLVAIAGAYLMANLAVRWGNFKVLLLTISLWIMICGAAYFTYTSTSFYLLAAAVGIVMGGIQSLSRSTYSKLMPETKDTASYFSFYDVTEKIAIVIGMFTFGFLEDLTGDMRNSILSLAAFFVLGFVFLIIASKSKNQLTAEVKI